MVTTVLTQWSHSVYTWLHRQNVSTELPLAPVGNVWYFVSDYM
jgi:hypothetical protein